MQATFQIGRRSAASRLTPVALIPSSSPLPVPVGESALSGVLLRVARLPASRVPLCESGQREISHSAQVRHGGDWLGLPAPLHRRTPFLASASAPARRIQWECMRRRHLSLTRGCDLSSAMEETPPPPFVGSVAVRSTGGGETDGRTRYRSYRG
jgi:hypothetical protein